MPSDELGPGIDAARALATAAGLGPYFAWEPYDGGPAWRPLAQLLDPEVIAERVEVARRTLSRMTGLPGDEIGEREVASITFLGIASRLVSPLLGAAATGGALPVPDIGRMWWQPVPGGPMPIAYRGLTAAPTDRRDAAVIAQALPVRELLEPVLEVFRRRFALSPRVLWGNVSSALGGAAGMIADNSPAHAARAAAIVEQALLLGSLRDTAVLVRPDPRRERWFLVRNNCCLYYRIPGAGTCGDCVLTTPGERHRGWQTVLKHSKQSM